MNIKQKKLNKIYNSFSPNNPEEEIINKKINKNKFKLYINHNKLNNKTPNLLTNSNKQENNNNIFQKSKKKLEQDDYYNYSIYDTSILSSDFNKKNNKIYKKRTFSKKNKNNNTLLNNNININKSFISEISNNYIDYFEIINHKNNSKEFLINKLIYFFSNIKKNNKINITINCYDNYNSKFSRKNKIIKNLTINNNNNHLNEQYNQNIKNKKEYYNLYESIDIINQPYKKTKTLSELNGRLFNNDIENEKTINNDNNNKLIKINKPFFSPNNRRIKNRIESFNDDIIDEDKDDHKIYISGNDDFNSDSNRYATQRQIINNNNQINKSSLNNNNEYYNINNDIINNIYNKNNKMIKYKQPINKPKYYYKKKVLFEEEYEVDDKGDQKLICVKRLEPKNKNDEINNQKLYNYSSIDIPVNDINKNIYVNKNLSDLKNNNNCYRTKNNTQDNFYIKKNNIPSHNNYNLSNKKSVKFDETHINKEISQKKLTRVLSSNYITERNYSNGHYNISINNNMNNSNINNSNHNIVIMGDEKLNKTNKISLLKDQYLLRYNNLNQFEDINYITNDNRMIIPSEHPIIIYNKFPQKRNNNVRYKLKKYNNNKFINIHECSNKNYYNNLYNNLYNNYNYNIIYDENEIISQRNQKKNYNFHEIKSISKGKRREYSSEVVGPSNNNVLYESKLNQYINGVNYEKGNYKKMKNNNIICVNRVNKSIIDLKRNQTDKYYDSQIINPRINNNNNNFNLRRITTSSSKYGISYIENDYD